MADEQTSTIRYRYTFLLKDGQEKIFDLHLDRRSLALAPIQRNDLPAWTSLGCHQCPNCPLRPQEAPTCPIAVNIIDLVDFFADAVSHEDLDVRITTDQRSYVKHTKMTEAISSLLGIYMVTSGCPVMDKLRPMVRFHLPLASQEETTFRALAMYLVAQFFVNRRGGEPDWELQELPRIYNEVQIVNRNFVQRLRETAIKDANMNALVRLDTFASIILMSLDLNAFDDVEALFESYMHEGRAVTTSDETTLHKRPMTIRTVL